MDDISRLTAALAGRYTIDREIGRGGMATVYLARDVRHTRPVALKVLSPELGAVLGAERFLSEIRVTANLQHPNLLPLFDSGEANGLLFYVMPYIEGESLRARLDREKQLPIDNAVHIATAIAGALDYAHRHGVIHRDLKPENILLHDGQPLVADFGIALAVSNAGGARVTQTGLSLGTPQYMSPEQATGDRNIDGRTDIYSLGALTYEMLAGEPPHSGSSSQAIIAKLMTEDPRPIAALRRSVPPHVEAAVRCALEKLPADRFATAKDFADALSGKTSALPSTARVHGASSGRRISPALVAGAAIIAAAVGVLGVVALRPAPVERSVEFRLALPGIESSVSTFAQSLAFSPDGDAVAYIGAGQGQRVIIVRRLDTDRAQALAGTDEAADITYSPDGSRLAYYKSEKIFLVGVDGTPPVELATIGSYNGITWANAHTIVYEVSDTLWSIDVVTRARRLVTVADRAAKEADINTPFGMPDGKTIAFVASETATGRGTNRLGFVSLDGSNRVVTSVLGRAVGFRDGWLLYSDRNGVAAVRFDLGRRKPNGEARPLLDSTQVASAFLVAMSARGDLAYVHGSSRRLLSLLGSRGEDVMTVNDVTNVSYPVWSPSGQRLAFNAPVPGSAMPGIWIHDPKAGTTARLATNVPASRPTWSPDGKRIAFINTRTAAQPVAVVPADGSSMDSLLVAAPPGSTIREAVFTPNGKSLVIVTSANAQAKRDIMLVALDAGRSQPTPLAATPADEHQPAVSPDGRWLAYMSDESGRPEIYVRPLNAAGAAAMLSKGGGSMPRWTRDGHVVYLDISGSFRRVELSTVDGLPAAGKRDSLFNPRLVRQDLHQNYDIASDGRFAVVRNASADADIVVVTNWWAKMRAKLAER
ncbi:MAG: protein kinase [Gemmatimonadetes bacterium]|nr:protein kinase [Gemmatimonadota bacterium]